MNQDEIRFGAHLALDNAGRLVRDAMIMLAAKRAPTALAIAVLAMEELGRRQVLLASARDVGSSEAITAKKLREDLDSHLEKLRRGQTIAHVKVPESVEQKLAAAQASLEETVLLETMRSLHDAVGRKRKRGPAERHQHRMKALYVDPKDDGTWSTPDTITFEEAREAVTVAFAEYLNTRLQATRSTPAAIEATREFTELTRQLAIASHAGGA